ncbi:MAG: hypothetical protein WDZ80_07835 [Candidatus Paceibacterota bacterium]
MHIDLLRTYNLTYIKINNYKTKGKDMLKNIFLLAFIALITINVNAQNMSLDAPEINTQAIDNFAANLDPFTGLEMQLKSQLENPCEDSVYIALKKMDINEMTDREYELYIQKDQACNEYRKMEKANEPQNKNAENIERATNTYTTLWIISGIVSVVSIIWLYSSYSSI